MTYDVWKVREDFPILKEKIYGKPLVGLLVVLNVVPLALLAKDFHPVLSHLYSRRSRRAAGILVFLIGVASPVGLLLANGGETDPSSNRLPAITADGTVG